MIYTVCEWIATISECMILFWFLITTLSYKEISVPKRFIGSTIFFVLLNVIIGANDKSVVSEIMVVK